MTNLQSFALAIIVALLPYVTLVNGYSVYMNVTSDVPTAVGEASRSEPASLVPLVLALAAPVVAMALGSLKPLLLAVGFIFLILFGLTFVPFIGEALQASFRAIGDVVTDSVWPTVSRDLRRVVGLDTEACRARAVCEITEEAVRKYPTVAAMLRSLTIAVQAHGKHEDFLKGLLGGLSGVGCESLYSTCAQSPFDGLIETS
ncbi:hypothetical protein HPB50_025572 [Hyalomma asiaticum]|uniref:Uncharacterized protein n=1 Tax=Hyalomma asiaticum TaxID=266040 RepID=A0ACB7SQ69_HYAAI|nr:hypothetical protein HPB50_025572 [Hyalomma asiaticum]